MQIEACKLKVIDVVNIGKVLKYGVISALQRVAAMACL